MTSIKQDVVRIICHVQVRQPEEIEAMEQQRREALARQQMEFQHAQSDSLGEGSEDVEQAGEQAQPFVREDRKVGRNEPCPCGSGKKYKQCHGKLAS